MVAKHGAGTGPKRAWTAEEIATVRELYGHKTAAQIGRKINRSANSVLQQGSKLGLNRRYGADPALLAYIREQHAAGLVDTDIARGWQALHPDQHVCRETIAWYRRKKLGLQVNRQRILEIRRAGYAKQLRTMGIESFAVLARRRQRRFVLRSGWPADLYPLDVRILQALSDGQYHTRQEIAAAIGCRTDKQRAWFKCRRGSQTALHNLVQRGLVKRTVGRTRKVGGKGGTAFEYWIPLDVLRKYVHRNRRMVG
jgi:predicted transcriptional regulator